jgi:hypothetical protein
MLRDGSTLYVAVPLYVPSVALTECSPAVVAGTVKEQLTRPELLAWQGVVTCWSPTVTVMGTNAVKPVPMIEALLPTGPSLGVTLKSGVIV